MDPTPIAKEGSVFGRIFNVLAAPGEVFQEIKDREPNHANWMMPAILWAAIGSVLVLILFSMPAFQHEMKKQQEKGIQQQVDKGKMTQAQADQFISNMPPWMMTITRVIVMVAMVVSAFVTPFFWGFMVWILCNKVFKADIEYMKAVEAAGLATIIYLLTSIVGSLLSITMGKMVFPSGALLVKDFDMTKREHLVFAAVNPFYIWYMCVLAVSVSVFAGVSLKRTLPWCLGIWLLLRAIYLSNSITMNWVL